MIFRVWIVDYTGEPHGLSVGRETLVREARKMSADQLKLSSLDARLIFAGRTLKDNCQLSEYGVSDEARIYLVHIFRRSPTAEAERDAASGMESKIQASRGKVRLHHSTWKSRMVQTRFYRSGKRL